MLYIIPTRGFCFLQIYVFTKESNSTFLCLSKEIEILFIKKKQFFFFCKENVLHQRMEQSWMELGRARGAMAPNNFWKLPLFFENLYLYSWQNPPRAFFFLFFFFFGSVLENTRLAWKIKTIFLCIMYYEILSSRKRPLKFWNSNQLITPCLSFKKKFVFITVFP